MKIRKRTKEIKNLKRIVMYLYAEIDENVRNEISKIIEESESEKNMSTIRERIGIEFRNERKKAVAEGRAEGIAQGVVQAMQQIIEKMLKMNFDDKIIQQITGAKEEEIEKIRKSIKK